jgi:hypothetical protein
MTKILTDQPRLPRADGTLEIPAKSSHSSIFDFRGFEGGARVEGEVVEALYKGKKELVAFMPLAWEAGARPARVGQFPGRFPSFHGPAP